jgi:hypothetical protein
MHVHVSLPEVSPELCLRHKQESFESLAKLKYFGAITKPKWHLQNNEKAVQTERMVATM